MVQRGAGIASALPGKTTYLSIVLFSPSDHTSMNPHFTSLAQSWGATESNRVMLVNRRLA